MLLKISIAIIKDIAIYCYHFYLIKSLITFGNLLLLLWGLLLIQFKDFRLPDCFGHWCHYGSVGQVDNHESQNSRTMHCFFVAFESRKWSWHPCGGPLNLLIFHECNFIFLFYFLPFCFLTFTLGKIVQNLFENSSRSLYTFNSINHTRARKFVKL